MKILVTVLAIIVLTDARTFVIKSKPSDSERLFDKKEFTFSQDKEDNKEPTIFTGDVQKSKVVLSENYSSKNKDFKFAFGAQNGIEIEQVGKLKDNKTLVVQGSYSYTGADGRRYRVRYTADELGFHPITELELEIPDPVTGEKQYKPQEPYKFPKFDFTKKTTTTTTAKPNYGYGVGGTGINAGNPFNKSNFPSNRYLPSNKYLPAVNTDYLPPAASTNNYVVRQKNFNNNFRRF